MIDFIAWLTTHNTLIIQLGFSVVLILIVIYVYRLFFVNSSDKNNIELAGNVDLNEVAKKMALVIQQQKGIGVVTGTPTSSGTTQVKDNKVGLTTQVEGATSAAEEVVALKAEVMRLQNQLNEAERKVFELAPTEGKSSANTEAAFGITENPGKSASKDAGVEGGTTDELNKKIEQLQARLSEYDIIADDIAELSQLRAENTELKKKLAGNIESNSSPVLDLKTEPIAEPAVSTISSKKADLLEAEVSPKEIEPVSSIEVEVPTMPASENKVEEILASIDQQKTEEVVPVAAEQKIEAVPSETSDELSTAEPSLAQLAELTASLNENPEISETDKNLMSDFEKSTQKG